MDEEIAPLILALWKADIYTVNSCQENMPGIAWVEFLTADDAAEFLNLVAEYEEGIDTLYNRITQRLRWEDDRAMSAPFWEYAVYPHDAGLVEEFTEDDEIESERVGFESGLTTAEKPVRSVSQ